jgi:hypothetical protein
VLPAHQRLHADKLAGDHGGLRLVVHDQLVTLQGGAQLAENGEVGRGAVVAVGGEVGVAAPIGLGLVHGDVGLAEQFRHLFGRRALASQLVGS